MIDSLLYVHNKQRRSCRGDQLSKPRILFLRRNKTRCVSTNLTDPSSDPRLCDFYSQRKKMKIVMDDPSNFFRPILTVFRFVSFGYRKVCLVIFSSFIAVRCIPRLGICSCISSRTFPATRICDYIRITRPCNVYPPCIPVLYSKTGIYRGTYFFLNFVLKHRLWVLVRTALLRRPRSIFEQKFEGGQKFSTENFHFYSREKSLYNAWACFCNATVIC